MLASSTQGGKLGRARQGTYSIVARDEATGGLAVAVRSHWFSVGPIVPWARPWVGAVATQANAELADDRRSIERVRRAIARQSGWAELLPRLAGEVGPAASVVCRELGLRARD